MFTFCKINDFQLAFYINILVFHKKTKYTQFLHQTKHRIINAEINIHI